MVSKIIQFVKNHQSEIILAVCVALMTYVGYNLGKISAFDSIKTPLAIINPSSSQDIIQDGEEGDIVQTPKRQGTDLEVVVSKKSKSMVYHFKWCSGAAMISPDNLLTFSNEATAIAAGYKLAGNCKR